MADNKRIKVKDIRKGDKVMCADGSINKVVLSVKI